MLELIMVLMLAGIVVTAAVPSYHSMIQRQKIRVGLDALNTSLALARNTAISKNVPVMLCPSSDGLSCHHTHYEQGWIIFFDVNENSQRDLSSEALIWVQSTLEKELTLRASKTYQSGIAFLPNGRLARGFSGNVTICINNSIQLASKIIMIASGRIRIEKNNISKCNL